MRKFQNYLLISILACIVSLPLLFLATPWSPGRDIDENRLLAPAPVLDEHFNLRRFTDQFDLYYKDNFKFRPFLIAAHKYVNESLLGNNEGVIQGKGDWLFLARGVGTNRHEPLSILQDSCGGTPFPDHQLNNWVKTLESNRRKLNKLGIEYVFVPAPNKHSVHNKQLPDHAHCGREKKTRLSQLLTELDKLPQFYRVDMRQEFWQLADRGERLFYKKDTHWNGNGMHAAYRSILRSLPDSLNVRDVDALGEVFKPAAPTPAGDLARLMGMARDRSERDTGLRLRQSRAEIVDHPFPDLIKGHLRQPVTWSQNDNSLSNALIMHDSFFALNIKHLLVNTFNETTLVWKSVPAIDMRLVEQINPDVVIHEMVERTLLQPFFLNR